MQRLQKGRNLERIITITRVLSRLLGLKADKSPGLHPRVLKEMALEIVDPLVTIFQNSLDAGMVPVDWIGI